MDDNVIQYEICSRCARPADTLAAERNFSAAHVAGKMIWLLCARREGGDGVKKKKVVVGLICAAALWIAAGAADLIAVNCGSWPIFCIGTQLADDGGSGRYVGLGYSFDIVGNFMPEDESPGVREWTYHLFGIEMQTKIRGGPAR